MSGGSKATPNYLQADGLVWLKRTNNRAEPSSISNFNSDLQSALNTHASDRQSSMELDKAAAMLKGTATNITDDNSEQSNNEESLSDQDFGINDEDVWDDSLLIKMYEASQKQINDELIKRFTSKGGDLPTDEVSKNNIDFKKPKPKTSQKKTTPKTCATKPVLSKAMNWKENDYCQLTYLEDNVDYEAKIVSINNAEQTCLVHYIGYENEEVRSLLDLKASEGERVRKLQIEMAIQDGYGKPLEDQAAQVPVTDLPPPQKSVPQTGINQLAGTSRIIPPPPPFLSDPHANLNNPSSLFEDEDDVLASMLMSWYMTGYHTGYYQARKDMKNNR